MPAITRLQASTHNHGVRLALSFASRVLLAARSVTEAISDLNDPFGGGGSTACVL